MSEKVEDASHGYLLRDDLLVRKRVPQRDCFVGEEMLQTVVPSKTKTHAVLQTAGHLGVRKTHDRVQSFSPTDSSVSNSSSRAFV